MLKTQIKSALTAGLYLGIGLAHVLNPFWWRRPLRDPMNPDSFELGGEAAFWYRLDQLSQSLRGRPWAGARERWMIAAHEQARELPAATVGAVDEFDWRSRPAEEFIEQYLKPNRPVVLRGFMNEHTQLERWGFERLLRDFGEERVHLSCPANPNYEGTLSELEVPGVYMHNAESLITRHPELLRELGLAEMAAKIRGPLWYAGAVQLFVGRKKTGSRWHCAPSQNLFMMLDGKKKWSFVAPGYSPLMSALHTGGDRVYWLSEAAEHSATLANLLDNLEEQDRKNVLASLETAHQRRVGALYSKCPRLEVELEPGDVLSVPPWWWHEIENTSDESVAAASRWFDPTAKVSPNPDLEALLMLRPGPAYQSSMTAFSERLMTLKGKLVDKPKLDGPVFDLEANSRLTAEAYGEIREGVAEYYARQGYGTDAKPRLSMAS